MEHLGSAECLLKTAAIPNSLCITNTGIKTDGCYLLNVINYKHETKALAYTLKAGSWQS